jgi:hypothetical protein
MKCFFVFILVSTVVYADEDSKYANEDSQFAKEDSQFAEIARLRLYASGKDESDLKVQPVLNTAQSKKKKSTNTEPNEGF